MKQFLQVVIPFLVFAIVAVAKPLQSRSVLHEKRSSIPEGWTLLRRHDPDSILPLRFGLTQPNLDRIEELLNDISHPESPNYGKHWSAGQVAATFAPSEETISTVKAWLTSSGISFERLRVTTTKAWIEVNATVSEAERLLKTEYNVFEHVTGKQHIACESYHLPENVSPHVELVTPTVHFNAILGKRSPGFTAPACNIGQPGVGSSPQTTGQITTILNELENCDQVITPACLRVLYEVVYSPLAAHKNTFGIVEYTPQAYVQSDLDLFSRNFSNGDMVGKSPKLVSIDGGVVQTNRTGFNLNGESNLDLEYGMNIVTAKQEVTLYQVGDLVEGASFNNLLDALDGTFCTFEGGDDPTQDGIYPDPLPGGFNQSESCGIVKPANVISTSYGENESSLTPAYTARQCAEYGKLGLMGVTVLYSSGDEGVAGHGQLCLNPDGSQSTTGKIFNPTFPGGCPFVTSVGATQVDPGAKVTDPEGACEQVIFSGGGFSNHFALPDYQRTAVHNYLANFHPNYPPGTFNATGKSRAFPDLSANGANYAVAVDGVFERVFGTSCATPVVGAILTLVNDARLAIGKRPIGFINPTIYSAAFADAFNDITHGGNQGCGTPGFNSTKGWDPVTGLGTPNFPKLLARWLLLP